MTTSKARDLVGYVLGVPAAELSEEDGMHHIPEWDSFAQVEIIERLEHLTVSTIPDELAFSELATIRGLANYLLECDS